jgi:hypothetical protein
MVSDFLVDFSGYRCGGKRLDERFKRSAAR